MYQQLKPLDDYTRNHAYYESLFAAASKRHGATFGKRRPNYNSNDPYARCVNKPAPRPIVQKFYIQGWVWAVFFFFAFLYLLPPRQEHRQVMPWEAVGQQVRK